MQLSIKAGLILQAFGRERSIELIPELTHRDVQQRVPLKILNCSNSELDKLYDLALVTAKPVARRISAWRDLRAEPTTTIITCAQDMETALITYIAKLPHKMLFNRDEDGQMLAYYAGKITFVPAERHRDRESNRTWWSPPSVQLHLYAFKNEKIESMTVSWHGGDKDGTGGDFAEPWTVLQHLEGDSLFPEREKSYERYMAELTRFLETYKKTGAQFMAEGRCHSGADDSWNYGGERRRGNRHRNSSKGDVRSLTRDGKPSRVVIDWHGDEQPDDENDNNVAEGTMQDEYWHLYEKLSEAAVNKKRAADRRPIGSASDLEDDDGSENNDSEESEDDTSARLRVILPVHPYVQVFDFESSTFVSCHINCLHDYEFQINIQEKLVLPESTKKLVTVLIGTAKEVSEDIVAGKSGGVIVMSTGRPGTGKTLTAEVFAEEMKIPIYTVQCTQLGITPSDLEERLQLVLRRAMRWGALLLLDEADVYTRIRGDDITQNAIVGVFLRLLERFNGILFMTSNRASSIDDAILSRCIAHIRYELPTYSNAKQIWSVLSDNYDVFLSPGEFDELAERFPLISGRNIKTLLKLTTAVSRKEQYKKGEIVGLINEVAQFVDFPVEHYEKIKSTKNITPTKNPAQ